MDKGNTRTEIIREMVKSSLVTNIVWGATKQS